MWLLTLLVVSKVWFDIKMSFFVSALVWVFLCWRYQAACNNIIQSPVFYDISHSLTLLKVEYRSYLKLIRDTKYLTHQGRVMHISISNWSTIGSDNGLSPGRCQAIIYTNAGILLIGPLGKYFGEFLAATKQLYEWFSPSVRPSVCLSVCPSVTPFWLCSHHRIIMKFSGVITSDRSDVHTKGQGQRSKVKVTEVTTQLNRFQTVTPIWIHIWWWNEAYSLIMLRRGALLFFKVIRQISRSHGSKNRLIWPRLGVSGL